MSSKITFKWCASVAAISIITGCAYTKWPTEKYRSHNASHQTTANLETLANAQGSLADAKQDDSSKIIKKPGWEIPGLNQSKIKMARQPFGGINDAQVHFTVLKPKREIVIEFTPDDLEHQAPLLSKHKWLVNNITEYDINRRVFCYKVSMSVVDIGGSNNTLIRYSASTSVVYYDEDGDSKFETLDLRKTWGPLRIPQWLRAASN